MFVASCRAVSQMSIALGFQENSALFEKRADVALQFVNNNRSASGTGGMWDGQRYVDLWYDGRVNTTYVLLDQSVGAYFNVVDSSHLDSIFEVFRSIEGPAGMRVLFPYIPNWGYDPGTYANGGVYPVWACVDITNRFRYGYLSDGERLMWKLGYFGLQLGTANETFIPYEYLDGDTGEPMGQPTQAWDASCFAVPFVGFMGAEPIDVARNELPPQHSLQLSHFVSSGYAEAHVPLPFSCGLVVRRTSEREVSIELDASRKRCHSDAFELHVSQRFRQDASVSVVEVRRNEPPVVVALQ